MCVHEGNDLTGSRFSAPPRHPFARSCDPANVEAIDIGIRQKGSLFTRKFSVDKYTRQLNIKLDHSL